MTVQHETTTVVINGESDGAKASVSGDSSSAFSDLVKIVVGGIILYNLFVILPAKLLGFTSSPKAHSSKGSGIAAHHHTSYLPYIIGGVILALFVAFMLSSVYVEHLSVKDRENNYENA